MNTRVLPQLLLISAAVARFPVASPTRARRCLTKLRGGEVEWSSYGRPAYRPMSGTAARAKTPFRSPFDQESDTMSDAEKVFVVQQFSQQVIRKRFLKRVYAILAVQLAATAGMMMTVRATPALLYAIIRSQ